MLTDNETADAEDELYKRFKYFSPEDARRTVDNILTNSLGFCGCGQPEAAESLIFKCLTMGELCSRDLWQGIRQEIVDNPDGALYIILYLLNHAELMEHGGSVPGWLCSEGEEMLKLLKAKREATKDDD